MSAAAIAAVVSITLAIIAAIGAVANILVKNLRSSPESRAAQTVEYGQLNARTNEQLDYYTKTVAKMNRTVDYLYKLISWMRKRIFQLEGDYRKRVSEEPPGPTEPEPTAPSDQETL